MKTQEKLNMTMLCDFYELTMGNGYFEAGCKERITYFDVFFRKVPDGGGFAGETCSARSFWTICGTSASPAISTPFRRVRLCSPRSRWWWSAHRPSRRS